MLDEMLRSHTSDVNVSLTYTALSVQSHHVTQRARAGEGALGVSAFGDALTGLQARHRGQSTLVYVCKQKKEKNPKCASWPHYTG